MIKDQLVYKSNAQDRLCLNIRAWYHLVSLGKPINLQLRLDDPASLFFFLQKEIANEAYDSFLLNFFGVTNIQFEGIKACSMVSSYHQNGCCIVDR